MEERRKVPRQRTFKGGTIGLDQGGSVECVVRNLSGIGACLETARASTLPNRFPLIIKPETIKRSCEVVWRSESRVGVQFT
jgi:hypothetical protein